jgi:Predicted membrane protein
MQYESLMYAHLATIIPCVFIGAALLLLPKGTISHKKWGALYMTLMVITSIITLFMPALVGPTLLDHFGFIHTFTLITLISVPRALYTARKGDIRSHKMAMISLYFGAILIAGGLTFVPGRYMHGLFFT